MRYIGGINVMIPWLDSDNNRTHTKYTFKGNVDRRRVKRMIRKSLRATGISAPAWWLEHYIKHRSYVPGGSET